MLDISEFGARTRFTGVRASTDDQRFWLRDFAVCEALQRHHILHVGVMHGQPPLRVVRTKQTTSYFFACLEGEGEVYVDGRWRACGPGSAALLPPHTLEAYRCAGPGWWTFCWVCYAPDCSVASVSSPVLAGFSGQPLLHAVNGLRAECEGTATPTLLERWCGMVDDYVRHFAEPWTGHANIGRLWEMVATRLDELWTLERLARAVHCSGEMLRRHCHRQLGRSPGQHVIYLRMRRAAELLVTGGDKIETVAAAVGYQNPYTFSTTFRKWMGCSPSEYRVHRTAPSGRGARVDIR
jgi:AraC-like DNA-binding protein